MEAQDYYYAKKMPLSKDSKAKGQYVIVEIIPQPNSSRKFGNIYIPHKHSENMQLIIGKISSAGDGAKIEGMDKGQLVFYDRGSAFGLPPEKEGTFIVTHMENVIAKVELDGESIGDALPFGDRIMVEDFKTEAEVVGGIIIAETAQMRSNMNTVHRIGVGNIGKDGKNTEFPCKAGDTVVLDYEKCTSLTVSHKKVYIVDLDKVLAVVVEDKPEPKPKKKAKAKAKPKAKKK